nr:liver carboxylesterase 4 [Ciona intestinalis]|eukprot:XP_002121823.1 liver carboxylesterase 4 [Ciona intestinalis]
MTECPTVTTAYGKVRGKVLKSLGVSGSKEVYKFAGVPFAKPPVGALRFEPPQKPDSWDGVKETTKSGPIPMQDARANAKLLPYLMAHVDALETGFERSEDCLYLDVYTPSTSDSSSLPVMVWIYGGGLQNGFGNIYHAHCLCALYDVVVVVPTYRVNICGFLTLGADTKWPGNIGMLDQVAALKWTRDNVKGFGGDPSNVTIFGESAGAFSVGLHVVSPMSKGLFHRAISHSGTAHFPVLLSRSSKDALQSLLEFLNIKETKPEVIVEKLKQVPMQQLLEAQWKIQTEKGLFHIFYSCVDNKFITDDPLNIWKAKGTAPVPYMVGCNNSEGDGILVAIVTDNDATEEKTLQFIQDSLQAMETPANKMEEAVSIVLQKYATGLDNDKEKWMKMYGALMRDLWFIVPSIMQCNAHAAAGRKTFLYYMTQQPRHNHTNQYGAEIKNKPDHCECDHADDILYTFGLPLFSKDQFKPEVEFSEEDKTFSLHWMAYITNFAKYGDPNKGHDVPVNWPTYDEANGYFLEASNEIRARKNLKPDTFEFWTKIIPAFIKK